MTLWGDWVIADAIRQIKLRFQVALVPQAWRPYQRQDSDTRAGRRQVRTMQGWLMRPPATGPQGDQQPGAQGRGLGRPSPLPAPQQPGLGSWILDSRPPDEEGCSLTPRPVWGTWGNKLLGNLTDRLCLTRLAEPPLGIAVKGLAQARGGREAWTRRGCAEGAAGRG